MARAQAYALLRAFVCVCCIGARKVRIGGDLAVCCGESSAIAPDGGVPERLKGTGCKPVGYAYVGSNPTPSTIPCSGRRIYGDD